MRMRDADFAADPYPGAVPPCSYVHVDAVGHRIEPDPSMPTGWRTDGADLDEWLAERDAPPAALRIPLLAYGSNRCPSKITWLRTELGLDGPVVVLRARTEGVTAVWSHGLRARDGQRPAVLAAAPGIVEDHAVWLATPAQVAVLDRCEGRGERFRLARLRTGTVHTEDGARVDEPWCYVGHAAIRRPLLVDGQLVRCLDLPQHAARELVGEPAPSDRLDASTVEDAPHPDQWPAALFAYGLLMPGQPSWSLVAAHVAGEPRPVRVRGALYDTGLGFPALVPGRSAPDRVGGAAPAPPPAFSTPARQPYDTVPGTVVPLRDPAAILPALDEYEGTGYQRMRLVADGTVCWVYAWRGPTAGLNRLAAGWPP